MSTQSRAQFAFNNPTIVKWILGAPEHADAAVVEHEDCEVRIRIFGAAYKLGRTTGINGNAYVKSWKINDKTGDFLVTFVW